MDTTGIVKAGVIGGIVAIVLEFIVGAVAGLGVAFWFSFLVMLIAGFIAGWVLKGKDNMNTAVAGALAGLVYVILGTWILFPLVSSYRSHSPVFALIIAIILGIGGAFLGMWVACMDKGKPMSSRKKR